MPLTTQQALDAIHSFDDPYLAALRDHGKQTWGLEGIRRLLAKLGDPHRAYPTIHIAGTKGKGSTSAFIAQGLIAAGLKTGLTVSPHLQDWRERIQINREMIAPQALARLVEDMLPHVEGMSLSAFEVTTALAFWHFARERCDAAVIEVGLGGRLDATSVVEPLVAVITNISLDHTQLLGETLAEIAGEKAAIIKPGVPVVSAPQPPEALAVIERRAAEQGARLAVGGRDWVAQPTRLTWEGSEALIGAEAQQQRYWIGLPGAFQIENAGVALAALEEARRAGLPVTPEAMRAALADARWPGRLEVVSRRPLIVLDSAHNPYSVERLVESLAGLRAANGAQGGPLVFVFGCMADKQAGAMLEALLPGARRVILTRADNPRAAEAGDLLALAQDIAARAREAGEAWAEGIALEEADDVPRAVRLALDGLPDDGCLCVAGSLAIAGAARDALLGAAAEAAGQPAASAHSPA